MTIRPYTTDDVEIEHSLVENHSGLRIANSTTFTFRDNAPSFSERVVREGAILWASYEQPAIVRANQDEAYKDAFLHAKAELVLSYLDMQAYSASHPVKQDDTHMLRIKGATDSLQKLYAEVGITGEKLTKTIERNLGSLEGALHCAQHLKEQVQTIPTPKIESQSVSILGRLMQAVGLGSRAPS